VSLSQKTLVLSVKRITIITAIDLSNFKTSPLFKQIADQYFYSATAALALTDVGENVRTDNNIYLKPLSVK
jgi:hypothetical protein